MGALAKLVMTLFTVIFIAACSDFTSTESTLKKSLQSFIESEEIFIVDVPLHRTSLIDRGLDRKTRQGGLNFALLQLILKFEGTARIA